MLSEYQLNIADLYSFATSNVEKLVYDFFDKKSMCSLMKTFNFT